MPGMAGSRPDTSGCWSASIEPRRRGFSRLDLLLLGVDGILQIDGYQGYKCLTRSSRKRDDPIRVEHFWANAQRKLKDMFDRNSSKIVAERLHRIAGFYKIEADIPGVAPGQGSPPSRRAPPPL